MHFATTGSSPLDDVPATLPSGATVALTITLTLDFWSAPPRSQHVRFTPARCDATTRSIEEESSPAPAPPAAPPPAPTFGPPAPGTSPPRSIPLFFSVAAGAAPPPFGAAATLPGGALAVVVGSAVGTGGGVSFFASVTAGAVLVAGTWMTTGAACGGCRNTNTAAETPKTAVKRS